MQARILVIAAKRSWVKSAFVVIQGISYLYILKILSTSIQPFKRKKINKFTHPTLSREEMCIDEAGLLYKIHFGHKRKIQFIEINHFPHINCLKKRFVLLYHNYTKTIKEVTKTQRIFFNKFIELYALLEKLVNLK